MLFLLCHCHRSSLQWLIACIAEWCYMPILAILLLLNTVPSHAEWTWIDKGKPGMTIYVNSDTIRRNGNLAKMWELFDFETAEQMAGIPHLSFKTHSEYDCTEGRTRWLGSTFFSGNMGYGKVVYSNYAQEKWKAVPPESVYYDLWTYACSK